MSRYSDVRDYEHRFHAGNVGDVWKHVALCGWLRALTADSEPIHFVDTHAGAGMHTVGPTGEWTAGIGRLDAIAEPPVWPPEIAAFLEAAGRSRQVDRGGLYPGSPAIAAGMLRPDDRLTFVEQAAGPRQFLASHFEPDERVEVRGGDGLSELANEVRGEGKRTVAFVDPSYTRREEWGEVANALVAALASRPTLPILLWYPIKGLTRPRTLRGVIADAGAMGADLQMLLSPFDKRKKALNGSGVLLVNPPDGLVPALAGAMAILAPYLARWSGWSTEVRGLGSR